MSKVVHEYRKAIADDCLVGTCSINNCLYPYCSPSSKPLTVSIVSHFHVCDSHVGALKDGQLAAYEMLTGRPQHECVVIIPSINRE